MSTKKCLGVFYFFQILSCLQKLKRPMVSTHSLFTFSLITQDLNKIKKNPTHSFVYICKQETCAKFQKKILNCRVVGARHVHVALYKAFTFIITVKLLCVCYLTGTKCIIKNLTFSNKDLIADFHFQLRTLLKKSDKIFSNFGIPVVW